MSNRKLTVFARTIIPQDTSLLTEQLHDGLRATYQNPSKYAQTLEISYGKRTTYIKIKRLAKAKS